jgi:hypothetical protein
MPTSAAPSPRTRRAWRDALPGTATGEALPFLRMTAKDHVRLVPARDDRRSRGESAGGDSFSESLTPQPKSDAHTSFKQL